MERKKIGLLALLLASLVGIGSASAFIINGPATTSHSETIEGAVVLEWGASNNIAAVSGLVPSTPQYRVISLAAPQKSASVSGTPTLSVSLVNGTVVVEKTVSLTGIKVEFATETWLSQSAPTAVDALTLDWSTDSDWTSNLGGVDNTGNPGTKSIEVEAAVDYYLKISISQEAFDYYADAGNDYVLSGKILLEYKLA